MQQCHKKFLYSLTFLLTLVLLKIFVFENYMQEKIVCERTVEAKVDIVIEEEFINDNVTESEFFDFGNLMLERRKKVARICNSSHLNQINSNYGNYINMMLMKEKRILYCPTYKVREKAFKHKVHIKCMFCL